MRARLTSTAVLLALALGVGVGVATASARVGHGRRGAQARPCTRHGHQCPKKSRANHHHRPARPRLGSGASIGPVTTGAKPTTPTLPGPALTTPTAPAPASPVGGSAPPITTPTSTPPPARLQITAREFSLTLSRASIAGGPAVVEFVDGGQDPHDLHIRSTSTNGDVLALPVSLPGSHTDQAITLPPGTYTLYCSLPQHAALGMQATLTVN